MPEITKHRWAVNFARRELTSYDGVRGVNFGRVGVYDVTEAVRNEVLIKIARRWPELDPNASIVPVGRIAMTSFCADRVVLLRHAARPKLDSIDRITDSLVLGKLCVIAAPPGPTRNDIS